MRCSVRGYEKSQPHVETNGCVGLDTNNLDSSSCRCPRISCEEIIEFRQSKGLEDLRSDRMLQLALEWEFDIIGEALIRIERIDIERLNSEIPEYRKIIGFRNLAAHGYDLIDDVILWDLAANHVPMLFKKIQDFYWFDHPY